MIDHMAAEVASDWYAEAVRRARASRKRRPESCDRPEFAPPVALAEGPLGLVQDADREIARKTALRARAVTAFAATRPASGDRAQGEPGAMSAERWAARPEALRAVSEWAAQELVVALSISTEAAEKLLDRSLTLVHRLPGTLAALEAGALHPGHPWPMVERVAPIEDAKVRAEVEAFLLRWAAGRVTTPAQLAAKARREVLRRDARAAVRRLERAVGRRGVFWRPDAAEGMGAVTALLTLPESRALIQALGAYADALEDDDSVPPRTRAQKMADCLVDLVLRPGESDRPPVQVMLTLVASLGTALGGDRPAEIDGQPVPAEMARALLRALTGTALTGLPVAGPPADPKRDQDHSAAESDEFTRRFLTGDLDDPDPTSDEDLAVWAAEAERRILSGEPVDPLCEECPAPRGAHPGGRTPGPSTPRQRDGPGEGPAEPAGWWAQADGAATEAGQTLLRLQRATARASRVVRTAAAADAGDEAEWRSGPSGRVSEAEDAMTALLAATEDQRVVLAELLDRTAGDGLSDRPRIAMADAVSGALLALTGLPELRRTGHCGAAA